MVFFIVVFFYGLLVRFNFIGNDLKIKKFQQISEQTFPISHFFQASNETSRTSISNHSTTLVFQGKKSAITLLTYHMQMYNFCIVYVKLCFFHDHFFSLNFFFCRGLIPMSHYGSAFWTLRLS